MVTNHGFIFDENMNAAARLTLKSIEGMLSHLCSTIMFVNHEDYLTATRSRVFSKRTRYHFIGNGVALEPFMDIAALAQRRRRARAELGLADERPVAGFVGRLIKEKGLMELVEVIRVLAARDKTVHVVIIGDSHAGDRGVCRGEFLSQLDQRSLTSFVTMLGFRTDIPSLLPALDVLCHPSYKESFGRVIVEAAMCSVPTVAFNVRGCRDVIVHRRTGLLVPFGDVQSFAEMTALLLSDSEARKDMGLEARKRAQQRYDETAVASAFCEVVDGPLPRLDGSPC